MRLELVGRDAITNTCVVFSAETKDYPLEELLDVLRAFMLDKSTQRIENTTVLFPFIPKQIGANGGLFQIPAEWLDTWYAIRKGV